MFSWYISALAVSDTAALISGTSLSLHRPHYSRLVDHAIPDLVEDHPSRLIFLLLTWLGSTWPVVGVGYLLTWLKGGWWVGYLPTCHRSPPSLRPWATWSANLPLTRACLKWSSLRRGPCNIVKSLKSFLFSQVFGSTPLPRKWELNKGTRLDTKSCWQWKHSKWCSSQLKTPL